MRQGRQGMVSRRDVLRLGGAGLALATTAAVSERTVVASEDAAEYQGRSVDEVQTIDDFAATAMDTYDVPGAAIAIVKDGKPLLIKGYGVREYGHDLPVDENTIFQLASNTKPMTAFAAATLVEDGLIGWDTPMIEVLPELRLMDQYATMHVTLRDLFAHRSGLPEFTGDLMGHFGYERAEILRRLRYLEPGCSFREVSNYSNLAYFIAGQVIERLTGAEWEVAVRERLMEPLGMTRSGPAIADLGPDDNSSASHAAIDGEIETVEFDNHGQIGAAGSAFSTASDMSKWMQMLLDGGQDLVTPETVRELFRASMVGEISFAEAPPIDESTGFNYGLGWGTFHWQGYEVLEKGGALAGVRTVVCLVPGMNLGVAVLANLNLTYYPEAVRAFVLEQFIGDAGYDMQAEIEERKAVIDSFFQHPEPPANPGRPSVPLENLAGTYANDFYGEIRVILDGGALRIEAGPDAIPARLDHFGHDTFLLDWGGAANVPDETTFTVDAEGMGVAFENESMGRLERIS